MVNCVWPGLAAQVQPVGGELGRGERGRDAASGRDAVQRNTLGLAVDTQQHVDLHLAHEAQGLALFAPVQL
jgi:hypothetical protein